MIESHDHMSTSVGWDSVYASSFYPYHFVSGFSVRIQELKT